MQIGRAEFVDTGVLDLRAVAVDDHAAICGYTTDYLAALIARGIARHGGRVPDSWPGQAETGRAVNGSPLGEHATVALRAVPEPARETGLIQDRWAMHARVTQ